uniref:HhH-GPD n=1 Tax=mine drainage metagenome TaxID=410659 RepID=E6PDY6_9ZZZZ
MTVTQREGTLRVATPAALSARARAEVAQSVARIFAIETDLSPFYNALADNDPLHWARGGAGRMLASPSVLEDLVKTLCSTNCAFSATRRMIAALVQLGGGAFPTAEMLRDAGAQTLIDDVRMGYRARSLFEVAERVCDGELDLESLRAAGGAREEAVAETLGSLHGFGPYAVAHAMQLLGFHRPLILDSWTRPTYVRLLGKRSRSDAAIRRDFARYGAYAGLAFWLTLTKDWVPG